MNDKIKNYEAKSFSEFPSWALLTAGHTDDFNTMVIGWGGLGTIWGRPAATVYVRESRYTREYMDKYDEFTISWYDDDMKAELAPLGKLSGRDTDKLSKTTLKPVEASGAVTFDKAKKTIVCKKIYRQLLDESSIPDEVIRSAYSDGDMHYMYIGEVTDIL